LGNVTDEYRGRAAGYELMDVTGKVGDVKETAMGVYAN
jgi:hypothetical protein